MDDAYTIILIGRSKDHARVVHSRVGYCQDFYGFDCEAQATLYVKRVGGANVEFKTEIFKPSR